MAQNIVINGVSYNGVSSISIPTSDGDNAQYIDKSTIAVLSNYNWSEDLIASSIDTDGNIYEGVGYKTGYRLNSSGAETSSSTSMISGYIPASYDDIFRVKASNTSLSTIEYIWAYDEKFNKLGFTLGGGYPKEIIVNKRTEFRNYHDPTWDTTKVKYVRFSIANYTTYPVTIHKAL